ncbi:sugar transport protein 8-like [Tripterygium wilfordii]|uniref:Sugar transport protein 8-like n=1 Tax=Tripterygium wilfordii TaxID=458696 RepID=A0A7J7DYX7_TRIWF|nr:sugar transport protein 8-like [Tripterygium wilfordii]KAF5751394.1 sugar transport protein 8-like [Tripterygium wilfordii]
MPAIVIAEAGGGGYDLPAKLTSQVVVCSIIAAFGGLMFGYDIGISGGVTSMDDFLKKFFPTVYIKKHHVHEDNYCKYDNQYLQLFTSSLYPAAIVASFFASTFCRKFGRKPTIQAASVFFVTGAILNMLAKNLGMLIAGRLCLGAGVGFGNLAVPLFISEIAPAKYRGGLNICFQLLITVGILIANMINYKTSNVHPYGWRISVGGASVPAVILLIGSFVIVETPVSLIERGKTDQGIRTLRKIRGVEDVEKEYQEILRSTEFAKQIKHPFKDLMNRPNRPPLVCAILLQVFQQFTGINVIMFYAPVLFQTMGFGSDASLLSSVVTGLVNALCTLVAILTVDRCGRKILLIESAIQMIIAQCTMGALLKVHLHSTNVMPHNLAIVVVILVCVFVSSFAWSWGPLGWLIASEIFPLETRNAGYFFAVSSNMLFTFLIAQAFLTMLCHMRSYIFFFFAGWLFTMGCFAIFMLPETKGIPIHEMKDRAWKKHWFWKRYFKDELVVLELQEKVEVKALD